MSVDGRLEGFPPDMGLYYGLAEHWKADAMLSGSNTLLNAYGPDDEIVDDGEAFEPPEVDPADERQLLVVVDSRGRLRSWSLLRQEPYWRDIVALCSDSTPESYLEYLRERHFDTIVSGQEQVDFRQALEELNRRFGVGLVRVDSGGILNGVLLREGLVDEVSVLISPCLVGGDRPRSLYQPPGMAGPEELISLRLFHAERVTEEAVWLRYEVVK